MTTRKRPFAALLLAAWPAPALAAGGALLTTALPVVGVIGLAGLIIAAILRRGSARFDAEVKVRLDAAAAGLTPVLARWPVDAPLMQRFAAENLRRQRVDAARTALVLAAPGAVAVWLLLGVPPIEAALIGAAVGGMVLALAWWKRSRDAAEAVAGGEVLVLADLVVVGGARHPLWWRRIEGARVADRGGVRVVELETAWTTPKGANAHETLRVPVPPGREPGAEEVVRAFLARVGQPPIG